MLGKTALLLACSSFLAAFGQLFLKYGADGKSYLGDFVNVWVGTGFLFYILGALLWVFALSKAPLSVAYPFTAFTFVLVLLLSAIWFKEPIDASIIAGSLFVLLGIGIVTLKPFS